MTLDVFRDDTTLMIPNKLRICAFDLGKNFAVAHNVDTESETVPYAAAHWVSEGDRVERAAETMTRLTQYLIETGGKLDVAIYERPFARGFDATRSLWGLAGIIEGLCRNAGLVVLDVTPSQIKKFAFGSGSADKNNMLAAARVFGYKGENEHEADAWCLLKYAEATVVRSPA